ncbi:tetratricopeptide repeat protein [uncultured Methanoregula sp.]|uniref:tetratricopeptide repeat protein n=1 Tax=uncultured Methanoregula sp. TaxID=1005933 RepID=UPI002AAABD36|nr:tetratricopeptide repeat protein [uncultured Methanoregula sp.]
MRRTFLPYFILAGILCFALISVPALAYSADAVRDYDAGNSFFNVKNYTAAIAAYDNAVTLEPGYYEAWNAKADALNKDKQYNNALIASDQVISLNPQYLQGWLNRGTILYMLGRYEDEQKAYDTAIALDPTNTSAWFFKGFSLGGMKKYDEAIAAFDKVKSLDPGYPRIDYYRDLAVQMRDQVSPFSLQNMIYIIGASVIIIGAAAWYFAVRKQY